MLSFWPPKNDWHLISEIFNFKRQLKGSIRRRSPWIQNYTLYVFIFTVPSINLHWHNGYVVPPLLQTLKIYEVIIIFLTWCLWQRLAPVWTQALANTFWQNIWCLHKGECDILIVFKSTYDKFYAPFIIFVLLVWCVFSYFNCEFDITKLNT